MMNDLITMVHANSRLLPNGCWEWTGGLNKQGYGQKRWDGRMHPAHRLSYMAFVGPIPILNDVDHRCHDSAKCKAGKACPHRRCVNPEHLRAMTHALNTQRRVTA